MKRGDMIIAERKRRSALIRRIAFTASGLCAVLITGLGIWHNKKLFDAVDRNKHEEYPMITETLSEPVTSKFSVSETTLFTTKTTYTTAVQTTQNTTVSSEQPVTESNIIITTAVQNTTENRTSAVTNTTSVNQITTATSFVQTNTETDEEISFTSFPFTSVVTTKSTSVTTYPDIPVATSLASTSSQTMVNTRVTSITTSACGMLEVTSSAVTSRPTSVVTENAETAETIIVTTQTASADVIERFGNRYKVTEYAVSETDASRHIGYSNGKAVFSYLDYDTNYFILLSDGENRYILCVNEEYDD